jgi:acyl dehydratase
LSELGKRAMSVGGVRMGINYGLNRVRFVSPVPAGARIRGRFVLNEVEAIKGGVQAIWNVTVERDGSEKPCCVAEWLVRYYGE